MIRKTLTILSLLGLLLSVGLLSLSVHGVSVTHTKDDHLCLCMASNGCLDFYSCRTGNHNRPSTWDVATGAEAGTYRIQPSGTPVRIVHHWSWWPFPRYFANRVGDWQLIVPLYLPAIAFSAYPACSLVVVLRHRKRKKLGLCLKCGYDLRASKDRCPECGQEFETTCSARP